MIRYDGIETKAIDGLTTYANALLELDGPGSKEFPEKEEFALVELVKKPGSPAPSTGRSRRSATPTSRRPRPSRSRSRLNDGHGHGH